MDPYIGEIRIFAGNFAPTGWRFCDGSLMQIMQAQALFAVIGTYFGGDGRTNFALPDLRGRAPIHQGTGQGLTPRNFAQSGGTPTVTLTQTQMPQHAHTAQCLADIGVQVAATGAMWAEVAGGDRGDEPMPLYASAPKVTMNPQALQPAGNSGPHNNVQPALGVNFIIAVEGLFPPRQ